MSGKSTYDCESGEFDVYDYMGQMIKVADSITVVLRHPKDKIINYPLSDGNETEKFISSLLNRERTDIRLYVCKPTDKDIMPIIEDNIDELRSNIETEIEVQYVDNFSIQFIASADAVLIENGFLGEEGLVETPKNNICDNPYQDSQRLIEKVL